MRRTHALPALAAVLMAAACAPRQGPGDYPLVPYPRSLDPASGAFSLDRETAVVVQDPPRSDVMALAERWASGVRRASGLPLPVAPAGEPSGSNAVVLRLEGPGAAGDPGDLEARGLRRLDVPGGRDEGYRLEVSEKGARITARDPAGLFYGLQTLRQLLPPEVERGFAGGEPAPGVDWRVPALVIDDAPRFRYRGLHLDVGRHLFPVEFIKRYIDLAAQHKLNVFHWHLTEDQGWRLEIQRYPRLTEVGAWRDETLLEKNFDPYVGDGRRYGGFYTQDEVREIVAYARERFVTVIPEIEMPGHSRAALAAYPELGCREGPFTVATRWGVFEDIYCPRKETFRFLEGVLAEVMDLFPSRYIHIGGDEAPKVTWEESEEVQRIMRREGLADEAEVQGWFIRRIEGFLGENGRRIIGWDEILEGGLPPEATVMSWRGTDGGVEAAEQGHDVIMTPTSHMYFDYYQSDDRASEPLAIGGLIPLEKVYGFDPIPQELDARRARHVLGAQGNVWTEYMKTPDRVEYMAYPRALALAEVVWSPPEAREWELFQARLRARLQHLDAQGVSYRSPD